MNHPYTDRGERLLLRVGEAATALGISRSRLYELIAEKQVPSIRIGCAVRIPVVALKEWLEHQVEPASRPAAGPKEGTGIAEAAAAP